MDDVDRCTEVVTQTAGNILRYSSSVIGGTIVMLKISGSFDLMLRLGLMSSGVVLLVAPATIVQSKKKEKARAKHDEAQLETSTFAEERVSAITTVRSFAQEPFEAACFECLADRAVVVRRDLARAEGLFMATLDWTVDSPLTPRPSSRNATATPSISLCGSPS